MDIPHVTPLRQTPPQPSVADVAGEVRRRWLASSLPKRIKPGMRVAVGCGSRGIANLDVMVRTTLDVLRELRAEPFIVAAMGSHGGATAEGQRELLAGYGVTAEAMGVPVKTDMDTVELGTNRSEVRSAITDRRCCGSIRANLTTGPGAACVKKSLTRCATSS